MPSRADSGKPAPPSARYVAIEGPGCPGGGYSEHGAYVNGRTGWYRKGSGGWVGDGCGGAMTAVPMSGQADQDDPTAWVRWSFDLRPVVHGNCAIFVYVPSTDDWRDAAGHPAFYDVAAGSSGPGIATFTIDQVHSRGTWVAAGPFSVRTAILAVTMHSRGIDWNASGPTNTHLAAAQVQVSCTATG